MSDSGQERGRPTDAEIASATPRGSGANDAQLGLFVLLGLISFVVVLFWMTDPATFRGRYMLVTEVDHAGGVRAGDPIQMQGVNIGRVHDFEMLGDDRVVITMEIYQRWGVPIGSETRMGESGMFGGRTLEVVRGPGPGFYADQDTIQGEGAAGGGILAAVDQLSLRAESVLGSIDQMLSDSTVSSVQGTARELESLLTELSGLVDEQRGELRGLTASLGRAAEGIEAASAAGGDIASAVASADSTMAMLAETSETLDAAMVSLNTVLGRMERGEGTLGRLSTDETLYVSMTSAAETLNAFLADLQANPGKYINISIF